MIFWRRRYTISDETVSRRLVKARKQTVREARKMIRRGELNGEGIALYLSTIDSRFKPIKNEIISATTGQRTEVGGMYSDQYGDVERELGTFDSQISELSWYYENYVNKAAQAGIPVGAKRPHRVNYDDLWRRFDALRQKTRGEKTWQLLE